MELTWWVVAIAGCAGLAFCILAVLLLPMNTDRRRPRPLANVERLTRLPEYVRAARLRNLSSVVTIALLVVIFAAAVIVAARPTGLPSSARESSAAQPEDIMLCVGGPVTDPAAAATLGYFAEGVTGYGTQRIGLTSANRRVVPLTRDYQYAAAQFAEYARPADQKGDSVGFAPPVAYVDYATNVEDVLALCLTGFPSFEQNTPQRRSLIYVGPESLREPGEALPALLTADRVRDMATEAGVQVNVLVTGATGGRLDMLARDTGGRAFSGNADVAAHLSEIRANPPPPSEATDPAIATRPVESPDLPLVVALLALAALALWPLVVCR